jgi:hypothetical protein
MQHSWEKSDCVTRSGEVLSWHHKQREAKRRSKAPNHSMNMLLVKMGGIQDVQTWWESFADRTTIGSWLKVNQTVAKV